MAPTTYQDYQEGVAPRWLRTGVGSNWFRAQGDAKDKLELWVKDAVKARFPSLAPPDALAVIGGDRQLDQGVTESEADYRVRLRKAWSVWPWAGTPTGLLRAFLYAGYPNVALLTAQGDTHTLDGSGDVVTTHTPGGFSFSPPFWNVFRVLFFAPLPASWSPSLPANNSDEVNGLRRIVRLWKAAHAKQVDFVVVEGAVWGFPTTQAWGDSGLDWGSTGTTTWTP